MTEELWVESHRAFKRQEGVTEMEVLETGTNEKLFLGIEGKSDADLLQQELLEIKTAAIYTTLERFDKVSEFLGHRQGFGLCLFIFLGWVLFFCFFGTAC